MAPGGPRHRSQQLAGKADPRCQVLLLALLLASRRALATRRQRQLRRRVDGVREADFARNEHQRLAVAVAELALVPAAPREQPALPTAHK